MIFIQALRQSQITTCQIFPQTDDPLEINYVLKSILPLFRSMKGLKTISHMCYVQFLEALYLIKDKSSA